MVVVHLTWVVLLVVEDLDVTLLDEVHFLHIGLVTDDTHSMHVESAKHVDYQIIGKASLAFFKEVTECLLKLLESPGTLDQLRLHFWSYLLVKLELLDDKVEVVHKGVLYVLSDVVVKVWLDVQLAV